MKDNFLSWEPFNFSRVEPSKLLGSGMAQDLNSSIFEPILLFIFESFLCYMRSMSSVQTS